MNPYEELPDSSFWRKSIESPVYSDVDPVIYNGPLINRSTKVATAGSCFAQHIARKLKENNFSFLNCEPPHSVLESSVSEQYSYDLYSARFGNIYTPRQLLQLIERAFDGKEYDDKVWVNKEGNVVDPFRPQIQPMGFENEEDLRVDIIYHLSAVKQMFESLNVFVFTLGLTEGWISKIDGAVFPLCPGVAGGEFDAAKYELHNFSVSEVIQDMQKVRARLIEINPDARLILTVSPVPLIATAASDRHVLLSTTYSKAVLRVAAEELCCSCDNVSYFPSYEIITGSFNQGRYFSKDLRSVTAEGVNHVMRLFMKHYTSMSQNEALDSAVVVGSRPVGDDLLGAEVRKAVDLFCDEEALGRI